MLKNFRFPGEPDNFFKFFSIVLIFQMGSTDKTSNVFRIVGNNQHDTFQVRPTSFSHSFQVSLYFERHEVLKHRLFRGVLIMIKTTLPLLAQTIRSHPISYAVFLVFSTASSIKVERVSRRDGNTTVSKNYGTSERNQQFVHICVFRSFETYRV